MITAALVSLGLLCWRTPALRDEILVRVPKLPKWAQPLAPLTVALLVALAEGYESGLTGDALLEHGAAQGGQIGFVAIGLWHVGKRWLPPIWAALRRKARA